MNAERDRVRAEALDWVVRTGDPGFDQWDNFTQWLERDPAHVDAYHALSASLADMDPLIRDLPAAEPVPVTAPLGRPVHWRLAVAASVAILAASGGILLAPAFTTDGYSTAPGETRTIAMGDGNTLVMNGDTRLRIAGLSRDEVKLEQGQVLLRLDGAPKVRVTTGDLSFVDIGTVFEVAREGHDTRLLVSEGEVMADPDGARVKVGAHEMLEAKDGDRLLAAKPASGEAGAWASGQLNYIDAPVTQVLADLRRSTGLVFSPTATMSAQRFSGTLSVADIRKDPASLGPLLGVSVKRSGESWLVERGS